MAKESDLPVPPTIDTASVIRDFARGLICGVPMEEQGRAMLEGALSDCQEKMRLMAVSLAVHDMMEHHKLLSALSFALDLASSPDYIQTLALGDPEIFQKHIKLLRDWHKDSIDGYKDVVDASRKQDRSTGDVNNQFNVYFGQGGSTLLPESLRDLDSRKRVQAVVTAISDILDGRALPKPPKVVDVDPE